MNLPSIYLGRVMAPDREAAIDKAMEEFWIEPARRFRLIAELVE
jgi:lipoate-protein ligase A